jgi:hypothetical protein
VDGLLIQGPQAVTVHLRINGIDVSLGSTAFVRLTENQTTRFTNIEGSVTLTSDGQTRTLLPGQTADVIAGQAPSDPFPYTADEVRPSLLGLFPESRSIPWTLNCLPS